MFYVIERIVNKEFQFRDNAQLMAQTIAQVEANALNVIVDVLNNLFSLL
jgi:hypothetical protein